MNNKIIKYKLPELEIFYPGGKRKVYCRKFINYSEFTKTPEERKKLKAAKMKLKSNK